MPTITAFESDEFVSRANVNSRLTQANNKFTSLDGDISTINNKFPVSIANGGTGATTKGVAVANLKLTDRSEQDFTASTESAYITAAQNYFDNNKEAYIPFTYNAGWAGQGYGVAVGVQSGASLDSRTLVLFNQKIGLKLYHKNANATSWKNYSPTGISLYSNSSGTQSTITLSETAANFRKLGFVFKNNDGNFNYSEIYSPNGKTIGLYGISVFSNPIAAYIKPSNVSISGTSVTWGTCGQFRLRASEYPNVNSTNQLSIYEVIGYRY